MRKLIKIALSQIVIICMFPIITLLYLLTLIDYLEIKMLEFLHLYGATNIFTKGTQNE